MVVITFSLRSSTATHALQAELISWLGVASLELLTRRRATPQQERPELLHLHAHCESTARVCGDSVVGIAHATAGLLLSLASSVLHEPSTCLRGFSTQTTYKSFCYACRGPAHGVMANEATNTMGRGLREPCSAKDEKSSPPWQDWAGRFSTPHSTACSCVSTRVACGLASASIARCASAQPTRAWLGDVAEVACHWYELSTCDATEYTSPGL